MKSKLVAVAVMLWLSVCVWASTPPSLDEIIAAVDRDFELDHAQQRLWKLREEDPGNPEILIQLARIEIKQASGDGQSTPMGLPSAGFDPKALERAESYLSQAAKLDPNYANTWVLYGHVAYLKRDFSGSLEMLERARKIGTSNPWLHINLGDTLWAMSNLENMDDLAEKAEAEYLEGLASSPGAYASTRAHSRLAEIYLRAGDMRQVRRHAQEGVDSSTGLGRAHALHKRATLLFLGGDIDSAVSSAREAMQVAEFPLGRNFLGIVLAVKAGLLYRQGEPKMAAELVEEAKGIQPDLVALLGSEPYSAVSIPIIYALHGFGALQDFSSPVGGRILVGTAMFGSGSDVEALLSWGADPNFLHPDFGTPLHAATLANNTEVVSLLLAHGAKPLTEDATNIRNIPESGREPGEYLVVASEYRTRHAINDIFAAGERLIYQGKCAQAEQGMACFQFMRTTGAMEVREVELPNSNIESLPKLFEAL